jgi:hypothetical protein
MAALSTAKMRDEDARRTRRRGFDIGDGFGLQKSDGASREGWYASFGLLFQGDDLGVEFALQAHEGLLVDAGLLNPDCRVLGNAPFPLGKRFRGLIIDDYFAIGAEPVGELGLLPSTLLRQLL